MAFDPLTAGLDLVKGIATPLINHFFPDPAEADKAKAVMMQLEQSGELAKMVNDSDVYKAWLADVQNARAMQMAALAQADTFSKRFIYYLTIFWSAFSSIYILWITFGTIPQQNVRFADTILGFLLGTIIATIITFFFGSSQSSKNKDSAINDVISGMTKK